MIVEKVGKLLSFWRSVISFCVGRIFKEFLYVFKTDRIYEEKENELGNLLMRYLVAKYTEGEGDIDSYSSEEASFIGIPFTKMGLKISRRTRIDGLSTLRIVDKCSLIEDDGRLLTSAKLGFGPLTLKYDLMFTFINGLHQFFTQRVCIEGSVSYTGILVGFSTDAETGSDGRIELLFIDEIEGLKLCISGVWIGVSFLLSLLCKFKRLVRNVSEHKLQELLARKIKTYEFPVQISKAGLHTFEEACEELEPEMIALSEASLYAERFDSVKVLENARNSNGIQKPEAKVSSVTLKSKDSRPVLQPSKNKHKKKINSNSDSKPDGLSQNKYKLSAEDRVSFPFRRKDVDTLVNVFTKSRYLFGGAFSPRENVGVDEITKCEGMKLERKIMKRIRNHLAGKDDESSGSDKFDPLNQKETEHGTNKRNPPPQKKMKQSDPNASSDISIVDDLYCFASGDNARSPERQSSKDKPLVEASEKLKEDETEAPTFLELLMNCPDKDLSLSIRRKRIVDPEFIKKLSKVENKYLFRGFENEYKDFVHDSKNLSTVSELSLPEDSTGLKTKNFHSSVKFLPEEGISKKAEERLKEDVDKNLPTTVCGGECKTEISTNNVVPVTMPESCQEITASEFISPQSKSETPASILNKISDQSDSDALKVGESNQNEHKEPWYMAPLKNKSDALQLNSSMETNVPQNVSLLSVETVETDVEVSKSEDCGLNGGESVAVKDSSASPISKLKTSGKTNSCLLERVESTSQSLQSETEDLPATKSDIGQNGSSDKHNCIEIGDLDYQLNGETTTSQSLGMFSKAVVETRPEENGSCASEFLNSGINLTKRNKIPLQNSNSLSHKVNAGNVISNGRPSHVPLTDESLSLPVVTSKSILDGSHLENGKSGETEIFNFSHPTSTVLPDSSSSTVKDSTILVCEEKFLAVLNGKVEALTGEALLEAKATVGNMQQKSERLSELNDKVGQTEDFDSRCCAVALEPEACNDKDEHPNHFVSSTTVAHVESKAEVGYAEKMQQAFPVGNTECEAKFAKKMSCQIENSKSE